MKVGLSPRNAATGTGTDNMGNSMKSAAFLIESHLAEASQGSSNAYFNLGVIYSTGADGVEADLIEAHKWFNIAGVNGNATGKKNADIIEKKMQPVQIITAIGLAREWLVNRRN